MANDFIPKKVRSIAKDHGAKIVVIQPPTISTDKALSYLSFASIELHKDGKIIGVELVRNANSMTNFEISTVTFEGWFYQEDDYGDGLHGAIVGLLEGRTIKKRKWLREALCIMNERGEVEYWPRTSRT